MLPRLLPQPDVARRVAIWAGWATVIYIVAFWRLGYPSFWDPDEAVYAVVTRRMLRTGDWLAPIYNGVPFFDKPILFYWLQLVSFKIFGPTEFAARLVPALSAVGIIGITGWAGRIFFNPRVGHIAALIVAVLPATFLLSAYAILDMTFSMFLFAGVVLAASAVVHDRPRRQWWGYLCLALAVLTKGPLALALAGVSLLLALIIAPGLRRGLWSLRFGWGLALIVALSSPWFLYMWWRFGYAFVDGYFLRENILLYAAQLFETTRSPAFYLRVAAVGFLPFTPLLIGRLVDAWRGDRVSDIERLMWAWAAGITLFFSFSRFKLDHYIYPVLPALALIAANAWCRLVKAESIRAHAGTAVASATIALTLIGAGVYTYLKLDTLPVELTGSMRAVPSALALAGAIFAGLLIYRRWRPPVAPFSLVSALMVTYFIVLGAGLDALEQGKPMRDLGRWVAEHAPPDATITAYRLERWKTSLRFYVDRRTVQAESPHEMAEVLRKPGTHFAVMRQDELEQLRSTGDLPPMKVVRERRGLTNTSGRGLRKKRDEWPNYVVVTSATDAAATAVAPEPVVAPEVPAVSGPPKGRPARRPPARSSANGRR
ncbi:MAG: glycosyltransferase family 39 protein [Acidobacteria bacterium]|nr:MAG: glycosyltransferase family 39 protein [Acidobacteriota bacterium]